MTIRRAISGIPPAPPTLEPIFTLHAKRKWLQRPTLRYIPKMLLARLGAATMLTLSLAGQRPPASTVEGTASAANLESRRAAIEQRLDRIAGHESTKATIRYPFDL